MLGGSIRSLLFIQTFFIGFLNFVLKEEYGKIRKKNV